MDAREQQRQQQQEARRRYAAGAGGMGGGGGRGGHAVAAAGPPPRDPGLTPIFNNAADPPDLGPGTPEKKANHGISSKIELEMIQKKRSQPRLVTGMDPLGNVNNAINQKKDQSLAKREAEIKERLAEKKGLSKEFNGKAPDKSLKTEFNQAAGFKR